jgi:hypothetical protein
MKLLLIGIIALGSIPAFASSLIECEGIDNPNTGIVKIITNNKTDKSQNVFLASFKNGTANHRLSDVSIDLESDKQIDHIETNGTRFVVEISKELLTDGSNTIRPYFFKSKVYFEIGGKALINSSFMKCRVFNNL